MYEYIKFADTEKQWTEKKCILTDSLLYTPIEIEVIENDLFNLTFFILCHIYCKTPFCCKDDKPAMIFKIT